ncbi:MAG: hypothetical protein QW115_04830 [Thermoplasmata archaeon]
MPSSLDVNLETDFNKVAARKDRINRENRQKDFSQRVKENILRMFEQRN